MSGQVILYFEDQADALRFALAAQFPPRTKTTASESSTALDLRPPWVRSQFPALAQPSMDILRFFWTAPEARRCRSR
jgi:hypothetical protein